MIDELKKLRELTEVLTGKGYLKDHTEDWEYVLDAIPNCIYIINTKFEINFINRTLAQKLNVGRNDLDGRICYKAIFELNAPLESDTYTHQLKASDVFISKLNGWYNVTKAPIYDKVNKLLGFICVLQDVTDRVRVGEIQKSLACSEYKYKLMLDNVEDVIWTMDINRNFTFITPVVIHMTGYAQEEYIGHNLEEFTPEKDFEETKFYMELALNTPGFNEKVTFTTRMFKKDKSIINIEISGQLIRDYNNNITGFQGITRLLDPK